MRRCVVPTGRTRPMLVCYLRYMSTSYSAHTSVIDYGRSDFPGRTVSRVLPRHHERGLRGCGVRVRQSPADPSQRARRTRQTGAALVQESSRIWTTIWRSVSLASPSPRSVSLIGEPAVAAPIEPSSASCFLWKRSISSPAVTRAISPGIGPPYGERQSNIRLFSL